MKHLLTILLLLFSFSVSAEYDEDDEDELPYVEIKYATDFSQLA